MDEEKPLVDQADAIEHPPADQHATAVYDVYLGHYRRVGTHQRHRLTLKEPRTAGAVEDAAVGHHLVRVVHGVNDRPEDAEFGMGHCGGDEALNEIRRNNRVVVEQNDLVGAALQSVHDAGVIPARPAPLDLVAAEVPPRDFSTQARPTIFPRTLST